MVRILTIAALAASLAFSGGCTESGAKMAGSFMAWQTDFSVDKSNLESIGHNPYFILEPGYTLTYANGSEILVITVLNETKTVDGVVTRVVEERETKDGQPIEISRNYFAMDKTTKTVYYFGEDVDMYKDGKVVSHDGSWLAGPLYKFGMMMPGNPRPSQTFYQELAPRIAMDRSEVISLSDTVTTPAGTFTNCLHTKDSSAIEKGTTDKWYAPTIGLVKDGDQELTKIDRPSR